MILLISNVSETSAQDSDILELVLNETNDLMTEPVTATIPELITLAPNNNLGETFLSSANLDKRLTVNWGMFCGKVRMGLVYCVSHFCIKI